MPKKHPTAYYDNTIKKPRIKMFSAVSSGPEVAE